jgi:SynChlorMet cassette radical SAM/SPASM protein ScmF
MSQCKNISVSVSLDGSEAKTHDWVRGIDGCFDKALRGISYLVEQGVKPQIIMSLMPGNRQQMAPLVQLSESLGAESVKFNIIQPTGRGKNLTDAGDALGVEELIELGDWVEETLQKQSKIDIFYDLPMAFYKADRLFGKEKRRGSICNIREIISVLSDGSYSLCGIGEHSPDLIFGHVSDCSLQEIWKNHPIINEIREGMPQRFEGVCGHCIFKKICNASCLAQNFYRTNNLWAPFWFCDSAFSKQLFPKSRLLNFK